MRHPEARIRVGIELDGFAFTGEVVERAGMASRILRSAMDSHLSKFHSATRDRRLFSGGSLGARIEQQLGGGPAEPDLLDLVGRSGVIGN